jgi:hypothetical protein
LHPKHHFMTTICRAGFAIRSSCEVVRFENKHQFFKRCICSCKNCVHVGSMLANRHQLHQATSRLTLVLLSPVDVVVESSIATELKATCFVCYGISNGTGVYCATIKRTIYERGHVLHYRVYSSINKCCSSKLC